jgi:hypothetical protein
MRIPGSGSVTEAGTQQAIRAAVLREPELYIVLNGPDFRFMSGISARFLFCLIESRRAYTDH